MLLCNDQNMQVNGQSASSGLLLVKVYLGD